ncbi:unnamed protein product [Pylaiella littoralis]
MFLDGTSEVKTLAKHEKDGRFVFRVTTRTPRFRLNQTWRVHAGSPEELGAWVAAIEHAIHEACAEAEAAEMEDVPPRAKNAGDFIHFPRELGPFPIGASPAFRGSKLSPDDYPLHPGQFLSTLPPMDSSNLEVTEVGDVILRRGDLPAYSADAPPIWAHRAMGSIGGKANGGLGCVVELWWQKFVKGSNGTPVHVAVKDGRWRVGRGRLCTMGISPKPEGSWRVHLPWDAIGNAIKAASLELREDHSLVLASGEMVLWSSPPPQ